MAKAEEHPLYVGKIAGLPTFWDCDDLDIEGLHLRQVRKDDEYNFYNSDDYHYMISLVPGINRWQITNEISTEVTTYKKMNSIRLCIIRLTSLMLTRLMKMMKTIPLIVMMRTIWLTSWTAACIRLSII